METQLPQPHHDEALSHIPLISPSSMPKWGLSGFQDCHDCHVTEPSSHCFFEGFHGGIVITSVMSVLFCGAADDGCWWVEKVGNEKVNMDQVWLAALWLFVVADKHLTQLNDSLTDAPPWHLVVIICFPSFSDHHHPMNDTFWILQCTTWCSIRGNRGVVKLCHAIGNKEHWGCAELWGHTQRCCT